MPTYPILPNLQRYRGSKANLQSKASEHNRKANVIADACNEILQETPEGEVVVITWGEIAGKVGLSSSDISAIGVYGGGHNGVTATGVKKKG